MDKNYTVKMEALSEVNDDSNYLKLLSDVKEQVIRS